VRSVSWTETGTGMMVTTAPTREVREWKSYVAEGMNYPAATRSVFNSGNMVANESTRILGRRWEMFGVVVVLGVLFM